MRVLALSFLLALAALPARGETFNGPEGWSLDLPEGWETIPAGDLGKIPTGDPNMAVRGGWRSELGLPFAIACWLSGERNAAEAADMVSLAGDRARFAREFKRQVGAKMGFGEVEVRRYDPKKQVVSMGTTMTAEGERLRTLIAVQAAKDGAVFVLFYVKEEDKDLHTATFDGIASSMKLAPGREYVPFPTKLVAGVVAAAVAAGGIVLATKARKQS